uniref:Uncharacterized protein n=1 Tax=Anopheles quadriannulatus TaxID=34691 RepID=A0A182XQ29_ANOQN
MSSIFGFIVKHSTYICEYFASNTMIKKNYVSATKGCMDFVANQSSTQANKKKIGSGQFWYQGVAKCLRNTMSKCTAIFCGPSKPSSTEEYLGELVDELNLLMEQSINLGRIGTSVKINLRAFVADLPARAFIKGKLVLYYVINNVLFLFFFFKAYKILEGTWFH